MRHSVFLVTNQLCSILGELGELFEVELAMAEGVSGRRRRRAVVPAERRAPPKSERLLPAFPAMLYLSICAILIVLLWQGEITGRQVTRRNLIKGITKGKEIIEVFSV